MARVRRIHARSIKPGMWITITKKGGQPMYGKALGRPQRTGSATWTVMLYLPSSGRRFLADIVPEDVIRQLKTDDD